MRIGTVFEQTSTTEFLVMLNQESDSEQLLFSYVEVSPDGGAPRPNAERIIARITNVFKENPLLGRDQAGVLASVSSGALGLNFSTRFTRGWAQCTVIGALDGAGLDMNRRVVAPNAEVHTPSNDTLRQLFFSPDPAFVPLGSIETFGGQGMDQVPVTLDADQMVTKHFCIFGMTGSGKTNTAARVLEELMARGHKMVVFDSHDDYENLDVFTNLFRDRDNAGRSVAIQPPPDFDRAVQEGLGRVNPIVADGRPREQVMRERLLRLASVVYNNTPARYLLQDNNRPTRITPELARALADEQPWHDLLHHPQVSHHDAFPELRYYGNNFEDFTIVLLQAFQGERYSGPQWRWLRANINQPGSGLDYLRNMWRAATNALNGATPNQISVLNVLQQSFNGLQTIYQDALNAGAQPLDMADFFNAVASREHAMPQTVYRLSLSNLTANARKALVYAVVTYFFRQYKFGGFSARNRTNQPRNAYPVLFVLEEARALIPKSSGVDDIDVSGGIARHAMRELAYEGRKYSLGFGLISQKPSTIDPEVASQSNTFILHQLKSPDDQQYVRAVAESMSQEELDMIKNLGTGRAIVAGIAVKSPVLLRVFFRHSEEGIQEPTPLRDELQASIDSVRQRLRRRPNVRNNVGAEGNP